MSTKCKPQQKSVKKYWLRKRSKWTLAMSLIVILSFICMYNSTKQGSLHELSTTTHTWTTNELVSFWTNELQSLVADQIVVGKLPYPEINDRFHFLNNTIITNTGKPVAVTLSTLYHWASKRIEGAVGFNETNKTFGIDLYIPSIGDHFEELQRTSQDRWQDAFQCHIIILFMHELEHTLATNHAQHIDVQEESRAWADTCRYTVVPLFKKYHLPLIAGDGKFYHAWKDADGDMTNTLWLTAIQDRYGVFDGKTNPSNKP